MSLTSEHRREPCRTMRRSPAASISGAWCPATAMASALPSARQAASARWTRIVSATGVSDEVVASITVGGPTVFRKTPVRVPAPGIPNPFSRLPQQAFLPQAPRIAEAARKLMA